MHLLITQLRYALLIFGAVLHSVLAAQNYVPDTSIDLGEPWRWTELEGTKDVESQHADYDKDGVIWFGYGGGLTSFDGFNYRNYPFDFEAVKAPFAKSVFCASDGSVYLVTKQCIAVLKPNKKWKLLMHRASRGVRSALIAESSDGSIWISSNRRLLHIAHDKVKIVKGLPPLHDTVVIDDLDRLWLRERNRAYIRVYETRLNEASELGAPVARIPIDLNIPRAFSALTKDSSGSILSLCPQSGNFVQKFDLNFKEVDIPAPPLFDRRNAFSFANISENTKIIYTYPNLLVYQNGDWQNLEMSNRSPPRNDTYLVPLSGNRILLAGSLEKSYIIDASNDRWTTYHNLNIQCEDEHGSRWFLTNDKQVVVHDSNSDTWKKLNSNDGIINAPNKITISDDGTVWVSGRHDEFAAISFQSSGKWTLKTFPDIGFTFSHFAVEETNNGSIIFGNGSDTFEENNTIGGIVVYKKSGDKHTPNQLSHPLYPYRVATLAEQEGVGLWVGETNLFRSDPSNGLGVEAVPGLPFTWIDHMTCDKDNNLWVSKWGEGLYRYDGQKWDLFRSSDGLISNQTIFALPSRSREKIWLLTRSGISLFDGNGWTSNAVGQLPLFEREGSTLYETPDGDLWINRSHRSWMISQKDTTDPKHVPIKSIKYHIDSSPPETTITTIETTFNEAANTLFSWKGFDKWNDTPTEDLQYSYRFSGQEWSDFNYKNQVSILNLQAGNYVLEVRARDRDLNVDPTPATLHIEVLGPIWKQPWFIVSMTLVIGSLFALIIIVIRMRVKHLLALEEFKLEFFTNLSHELRTPLSVILGPLESLTTKVTIPEQKETLNMVLRNTHRMIDLVNKLLDFRKVELGKLKYRPVQGEVIGFIKDAVYRLTPLWNEKNQKIEIIANVKSYRCGFDPDKLQSIVENIVSNAIKYTQENGCVNVSINIEATSNDKAALQFQVKDNGIGIPKEEIPNVTDPFYRAEYKHSEQGGSGIGLALVSGLVQTWGGEAEIESETSGPLRGTSITVHLPLNLFKGLPSPAGSDNKPIDPSYEQVPHHYNKNIATKPKILIVEDNQDVLKFLHDEISEHYEVNTASNGFEGLEQIQKFPPELIVTDVMMPKMDGIEFTRQIRKNSETCHIPIIILTARTADEHYIEGIETGADEYFSKPIRADRLIARIQNLLTSRQQLRDRFSDQLLVEPKKITVVSSDKLFLEKAIETLEKNLQTEGYDVEFFAKDLKMSRVTLYRKLKAITGLSTVDFIRTMRLKRAAHFLKATDVPIGEILIQVGYYDASSFSRAFKKEFNKTPTQYRESEGP